MLLKICFYCGKKFKPLRTHKNPHRNKYCSVKCKNLAQKGKRLSPATEFKKGLIPWAKENLKGVRCSPSTEFKKGNIPWNKQGYIMENGYRCVLVENHPNGIKKGNQLYIRESRFVAEKILGRYLEKGEVVHHINKEKADNRPENLYLFKNNAEHMRYHHNVRHKIISDNLVSNFR